ncbi:tail fiber assembly protein [Paludibacterium denitrificans]|uniref:Tail fiber assembly protein n=1 Tax=Paludibacterium denitrificans TaxID=2675226 RepID=A0A844GEM1_9NEIS|nr:tail fiber assembly protein [Paludibacterium denitrificans]MTD33668.1 hypothetical protein [Paludibacterium denitrificans]
MAALDTLLYSFDPATGESNGQPFTPNMDREGNPLRPAFTTFNPVPEAGLREVALFLDDSGSVPLDWNGSWRIRPDWRGVPLWSMASGEPVSIQRPGQTPADISAIDAEPPAAGHYWDGSGWKLDTARHAQRLAELRYTEARTALSASDTTLMRCYEAGIALPAEWVAYRKALRAIISAQSGDPTQLLPTRPAYPEGT